MQSSKSIGRRGFAMLMAGLMVFTALAAAPVSAKADAVSSTIPAGNSPAAVAVNPVTNKVYIANIGSGTVTVINGNTNARVNVTAGAGAKDIAVNTVTNRVYVVNRDSNNVTVIDGATDTVIKNVQVGTTPWSVAVNPVTNMIYVVNSESNNVTVINGATNGVAATVQTGYRPYTVAVNPVTNVIYVASVDDCVITAINGATNIVSGTILPEAGSTPMAIAVNLVNNRIYVANGGMNSVSVINGDDNTVTNIAAGDNPVAIAVNPLTGKVYTANISGNSMTVIDQNNNSITKGIAALPSAIAVNAANNKIYTVHLYANSVTVIDGATDTPAATVEVGANPQAVAVNPVTGKVYTANSSGCNVTVIDGDSNVTTTVPVGDGPLEAAVNPVTGKLYVVNQNSNDVTVIDGKTHDKATVPVGVKPLDVAVNPVTNKIYVSNETDNSVTVIDGDSNATATVAVGEAPNMVEVNPVTNRIYVVNKGSGSNSITVIDGATDTVTATVELNSMPHGLAVNPVTNMIYVAMPDLDKVMAIDGSTNTYQEISVCEFPHMIAVNPVTNKIYVTGWYSLEVTMIDGATNGTTPISLGIKYSNCITVNTGTNKVYISNSDNNVIKVLDGETHAMAHISTVAGPSLMAVNPVTNKLYVGSGSNVAVIDCESNTPVATLPAGSRQTVVLADTIQNKVYAASIDYNNVTVIDAQNEQAGCLTTAINPLPHNATSDATPTFGLTASSAYEPNAPAVSQIWYQVDTTTGPWHKADSTGSSTSATLSTLAKGMHILYAFATDGMDSTSVNTYPANGSIPGAVAAYAFTVVDYAVNASANDAAHGTVTGGGTFSHAEQATLHAEPKTGYHFTRWTQGGTEVSTDADYTFGVLGMRTLTAEFAINNYTVNAAANNASYGTVTGGGAFDHGSSVALHAAANAGYHFLRWTEGGAEVSANADYTFTAGKDRTLTAEFAIDQYLISASANNAAYGTVTGGGTYNHDTSVTLHATPAAGYHFVRWTEGGTEVSKNADYTFTVAKARLFIAEFAINLYAINASPNSAAYGTVTGGGTYSHGTTLTLHAAPAAGYHFVRWAEGGAEVSSSADYTFKVDKSRTLTAEFAEDAVVPPETIPVTITCQKTDVDKYGASTGTITVTAAGGNSGAYLYSVDGGVNWQPSGSFVNLAAGSYTALARDANNAVNVSAAVEVTITQPKLAWMGSVTKLPAKAAAGAAWVVKEASTPKGYTFKSVKYTSSNPGVASVDAVGNVTFLKGGKVKLTVTTVFQKGKKLKTVKTVKTVTVTQLVSTITLNKTATELKARKTLKLVSKINPSTATNKKVKWKSSNTKIATVSSSGVVTARKAGTVTITCTAQDGSKVAVICLITVK